MYWQYINDGGRTLPKNYHSYTNGNLMEAICALCGTNAHDGFPLLYIPNDFTKASKSGAHTCAACQNEVDEMLETVHFHSYKEVLEMVSGAPSLRSEISEFNKLMNNIKKRFVDKFEFPVDTKKHIEHLDPEASQYADMVGRCIFCKNLVVSSTYARHMDIPVEQSTYLNGGKVILCIDCEKSLPDVDYIYKKAEESATIRQLGCSDCGESYYVYRDEYNDRYPKNHYLQWLCPKCVYNEAIEADLQSIKYVAHNTTAKYEGDQIEQRYRVVSCLCLNKVAVDLCASTPSLMASLLVYKHDKQYILCDDCNDKVRPVLEDKLSKLIRIGDTWKIVFVDNPYDVVLGVILKGNIKRIDKEDVKGDVASAIFTLINRGLKNI